MLKVSALTGVADYFVICSGASHRQVQAVAEAIEQQLARAGCAPMSVEGTKHAGWILMDYHDLIVHIFKSDMREFYRFDQLWGDAPKVRVTAAQLQQLTVAPKRRPVSRGRRSTSSVQGT